MDASPVHPDRPPVWRWPIEDEDGRVCGHAVAGHRHMTTRTFLDLLDLLAAAGGDCTEDVADCWVTTGSVHHCELGGDPTGKFAYAFDGETFASDHLAHHCPDDECVVHDDHNWDVTDFGDCRCSAACPGDGEDLELVDPRPVTVAIVDWDRWLNIVNRRIYGEARSARRRLAS